MLKYQNRLPYRYTGRNVFSSLNRPRVQTGSVTTIINSSLSYCEIIESTGKMVDVERLASSLEHQRAVHEF